MPRPHVTVWDDTEGIGPPAILVHGSTSWGDDPAFGFAAQRPLAARARLLALDRRGHGDSPAAAEFTSDYLADADDIADLLGRGAHLVGHSYGAVGAMLAAARRPEAVLSLALIEPGCYQVARDDPAVAEALRLNREAYANAPADLSPEDSLRGASEAFGLPPIEPTPRRLRAARAAADERLCWEADIPVAPLARAPWPKLVISGTWERAPEPYRERGGEPIMACARVTARRIGARHLSVPGTAHYPHVEDPATVNTALATLWTQP
ncbi:alpha/beta fold hydrolase [Spirillospora sp. CA-294931]|uniref:alpha/beta fold hydrolase n=1 Tax=Spirillospora sp. CA-294931 TaxID=3240042 RepID=UPI003D8FAAC9